MSVPQLSDEQRRAARTAATAARRRRAELKGRISSGEITLADALDVACADDVLASIPVAALLKAVPRVGEKRAAQVMERHEIAANRRVRGLGHRQLAGLKDEFR